MNLDFRGENFACSVSAVVIYPAAKAAQGRQFLDYVVQKRRFFFDNYFHRILHKPTGDPLRPTAAETRRGYVVFTRDTMQDVYYNDTPSQRRDRGAGAAASASPARYEPLTVAIYPLADLGTGHASSVERPDRPGHDPRRQDRGGLRLQPRQPRDGGRGGLHDRAAAASCPGRRSTSARA